MKRFIAIAAAVVVACTSAAAAQPASPQTLAELARAEEARRKAIKKPAKVYTNDSLKPDISVPLPPSTPASTASPSNTTPANATPTISGGQAAPVDPAAAKDQAYWAGRMSKARTDLNRTQMFADALQSRISALKTDFVNRDNPVERSKIEQDLNAALAELERVRKELEAQQAAITAIQDDARRANVPAGWLRPPA
jgi:hypothetical protein